MQTLTIKINSEGAVKLIEDMAALNLLEVVKKPVLKEKRLSNGRSANGQNRKEGSKNTHLRKLLLDGPVFTKKQIETIEDTRKSINKWRAS